jgi:hypothetical protein
MVVRIDTGQNSTTYLRSLTSPPVGFVFAFAFAFAFELRAAVWIGFSTSTCGTAGAVFVLGTAAFGGATESSFETSGFSRAVASFFLAMLAAPRAGAGFFATRLATTRDGFTTASAALAEVESAVPFFKARRADMRVCSSCQ